MVYHVINRGVGKQELFFSNGGRKGVREEKVSGTNGTVELAEKARSSGNWGSCLRPGKASALAYNAHLAYSAPTTVPFVSGTVS